MLWVIFHLTVPMQLPAMSFSLTGQWKKEKKKQPASQKLSNVSRQHSMGFTDELLETFHQNFRCHICFLRTVDHVTVFVRPWNINIICLLLPNTACQDRAGCTYMEENQQRPDSISLIPFPMTFHYRPTQKNMYCPWLMQKGVMQAPKRGRDTFC